MNNLKIYFSLLIGSFILSAVYNQDSTEVKKFSSSDSILISYKVKWAENSFENMAYLKAKESFEEIVAKGYLNENIIRPLAISCYKIEDSQNAEKYYAQLIRDYTYTADDVYNYAQVLKINEKYSESDQWMIVFASLKAGDSRIERQGETLLKLNALKGINNYELNNVPFNTEYSDFGPSLYGNDLYFSSARQDKDVENMKYAWNEKPFLDVYVVDSIDNSTSHIPKYIKKPVNSRFHDGPVCFNADNSEMFLTRNGMFYYLPKKSNSGVSHLRILHFDRNLKKPVFRNIPVLRSIFKGKTWKSPEEMPFNSKEYSSGHPSLTGDGKRLYFASDMPGGLGASDIYYVDRLDTGWSKPVNLGKTINTEGNEMFPFIHSSKFLYFASDGHLGIGGLDMFVAKQSNEGYEVKNMGYGINSELDDFSLIMDNAGKSGYFASNRSGGKGDDDIYKFTVLHPIVFDLELKITVIDKETKLAIENADVLFGETGANQLNSKVTKGIFTSEISPEKTYQYKIEKEGYSNFTASLNPKTADKNNGQIELIVELEKLPPYGIYGKVYLKETMEPVPAVKLSVKAINYDTSFIVVSDDMGEFRASLKKETTYELLFEKENFFTKRAAYSTYDRPAGFVNVNEFIDLAMEKIEINKTIEIPNIYYDLGKWNIRKDASVELDKVVQFLLDNPNIKIELGSHTDSRGTIIANQTLSQKRAQSAVDYIVTKGIDKSRISAMGYGESKLKNQCADGIKCSEVEHQQNRRTEIKIVGF